jgi:hypothetical protein
VQAGGESYLIDAGRPEEGPNVVDFLRSRGIDSLDGIVVYESPKLTERPRSASVPWSPRAVTEKCNFTEPEVRPWRILRSS